MDSPVILELGTQRGRSATAFLAACEETGGALVSVDIQDCSNISEAPNFIFVQSDSTAVPNIMKQAPLLFQGIHILYIDTTRNRAHLEKEVAGWWPFIKSEGWLFCRGVDPGAIPAAMAPGYHETQATARRRGYKNSKMIRSGPGKMGDHRV
jgi:Methyltransferase domain